MTSPIQRTYSDQWKYI